MRGQSENGAFGRRHADVIGQAAGPANADMRDVFAGCALSEVAVRCHESLVDGDVCIKAIVSEIGPGHRSEAAQ